MSKKINTKRYGREKDENHADLGSVVFSFESGRH